MPRNACDGGEDEEAGDSPLSSSVRFTIPFWPPIIPHSKYLSSFPGLNWENIPQISAVFRDKRETNSRTSESANYFTQITKSPAVRKGSPMPCSDWGGKTKDTLLFNVSNNRY